VTAAYVAGEERIRSAGLRYSNAEVFAYVSKVARLYQQNGKRRVLLAPVAQTIGEGGSSP
jgi:hypothetical protein